LDNREELFPHYRFIDWPFAIVPDSYSSSFLADRRGLKTQLSALIRECFQSSSNIRIVWGWFGAGKSHVLRYLQHQFLADGHVIPVYHEFPREKKTPFLNLYREFAKKLELDLLSKAYLEASEKLGPTGLDHEFMQSTPFTKAMRLLCTPISQETKELAYEWLCRDRPLVSELRKNGITKNIDSIEDAIQAIYAITKLIKNSTSFRRLVWIIDEFNNIDDLKNTEEKKEVLSSISSLLNTANTHLTIILSFGFPTKDAVKKLLELEPSLISRIGSTQALDIPEWTDEQEVFEFIRDRLSIYRPGNYKGDPYYPFSADAIEEIINFIQSKKNEDPSFQLIPRVVLDRLKLVATKCEEGFINKKSQIISKEQVRKILAEE